MINEDAGYETLLEQAEEELSTFKISKTLFSVALTYLKCMCGWSIKLFNKLLQLLDFVFPYINPSHHHGVIACNYLGT